MNFLELPPSGVYHRLRSLPGGLYGGDLGAIRRNVILRLRVVDDHVDALAPQGAGLFSVNQGGRLFVHFEFALPAALV